jgi:hypothetical protein
MKLMQELLVTQQTLPLSQQMLPLFQEATARATAITNKLQELLVT